jgi:hypothetical protein
LKSWVQKQTEKAPISAEFSGFTFDTAIAFIGDWIGAENVRFEREIILSFVRKQGAGQYEALLTNGSESMGFEVGVFLQLGRRTY